MNYNTTFYPQIDGQVESMLKACVNALKGDWVDNLPLIEFSYNNGYLSRTQMDPYAALYWRIYRFPIGWFEIGEACLIGQDLVHQAMK